MHRSTSRNISQYRGSFELFGEQLRMVAELGRRRRECQGELEGSVLGSRHQSCVPHSLTRGLELCGNER